MDRIAVIDPLFRIIDSLVYVRRSRERRISGQGIYAFYAPASAFGWL